jgi:hypothetical protein
MDISQVYIRDSLLFGELIEIGVTCNHGTGPITNFTTLTYNEAEELVNQLKARMNEIVTNELEVQYGG